MDAVQKANSGHPGMPMGAAPMAHALWSRFLRFNPKNPNWFNRDRFVLSAGHGSMLIYSLLHLSGFDLGLEELQQFRQLGSRTPGHPENGLTPGVEMATGPLGQGMATAVGMALAERYLAAKYNRPHHSIIDHFTYVICSDGDLMEGITNEAGSLAGHQKLGKLICLYDDNGITIDGPTSLAFTEHAGARFASLGWHVMHVDGMDVEAVAHAIAEAQRHTEQPSLICCRTVIGYGSPAKAGTSKSHGAPLGPDEVIASKQSLGVPTEPTFWKAPEAEQFYRDLGAKGSEMEAHWNEAFQRYAADFPAEAAELSAWIDGDSTKVWDCIKPLSDKMATRQASQKTIQLLGESMANLITGSADLAESNFTAIETEKTMQPGDPTNRNVAYGVREHAMAAAVNGMNLHGGVRSFGGTFLIFSDYCRPSIRLAALMHCPSIFVFTHDSIGVGEDGPTHQPIEHLMSLRAIPNVEVFRPADGNETAVCWAMAWERASGPSILALTRQALPSVTPDAGIGHPARKGAYVLSQANGKPEVVLIATGSEVSLALEVKPILEAEGIAVSVVSMPAWRTFEAQDEAYRDSVLPSQALKVSIEMGTTLGWQKFSDLQIGLDTFGASAPLAALLEHFGFTAPKIAGRVLEHIRKPAAV
jgi:transketolase